MGYDGLFPCCLVVARVEELLPKFTYSFPDIWITDEIQKRLYSCHNIIVSVSYYYLIKNHKISVAYNNRYLFSWIYGFAGYWMIQTGLNWVTGNLVTHSGLFCMLFWDSDWIGSDFPGITLLAATAKAEESKLYCLSAFQSLVVSHLLIFHWPHGVMWSSPKLSRGGNNLHNNLL